MFGTVARFTLKAGAEDQFIDLMRGYEEAKIPGHISSSVYRLREGERDYMMATAFASETLYRQNAESPEQNARFLAMSELLEGEPVWHDGDIVLASEIG
jgi:antibiotic biosynthesis monooxygenase (ABM) superfamily enzyme